MTPCTDNPPLFIKIKRALMKRWGSSEAKQRAWNSEYSVGYWDRGRSASGADIRDAIYNYLERYGADGSILDLGCGDGTTAKEMVPNFRQYLGVDVSDIAIERASMALSLVTDRADKTEFSVGDIFTFEPPGKFSVILFRESLQYVPVHRLRGVMTRYRTFLAPNGVVMVRLCDRHRYQKVIDTLQQDFSVVDFYRPAESVMAILVCSAAHPA